MFILATRGWNDLLHRNLIERLMDRVILFFGGVPETIFWCVLLLVVATTASDIEAYFKRRRLVRQIGDLEKRLKALEHRSGQQLYAAKS